MLPPQKEVEGHPLSPKLEIYLRTVISAWYLNGRGHWCDPVSCKASPHCPWQWLKRGLHQCHYSFSYLVHYVEQVKINLFTAKTCRKLQKQMRNQIMHNKNIVKHNCICSCHISKNWHTNDYVVDCCLSFFWIAIIFFSDMCTWLFPSVASGKESNFIRKHYWADWLCNLDTTSAWYFTICRHMAFSRVV